MTTVYDFSAKSLGGKIIPLGDFKGQVLVIVNTASECGFTPQYAGLEALYKKYKDRKFSVLGFPCNQFGAQEPGRDVEIAQFCEANYGVDFPMFSKIDVNGPKAHPLFTYLKEGKPGVFGSEAIKWNFTKFLIDKNGDVANRFAPTVKPEDMSSAIEEFLT